MDKNCGCSEEIVHYEICNTCPPEQPCDCEIKDFSTDCSVYSGDDLSCSGIKKGTILTELFQQLDAFICTAIEELKGYFNIINIGNGAKVYAGVDGIGQKKLRTLTSSDGSVTISENTETINFTVPEANQNNFVRNMYIDLSDIEDYNLDLPPTATQINDYLSGVIAADKTLADTDSKWNLIFYTTNPT